MGNSRILAMLAAAVLVLALAAGSARAELFECTPTGVAVFTGPGHQRMHVRCSAPYPGSTVAFFAFPTKIVRRRAQGDLEYLQNANADRFLDLATAALAGGRTLRIWFDLSNLDGAAVGCQTGDCRLIQALELI